MEVIVIILLAFAVFVVFVCKGSGSQIDKRRYKIQHNEFTGKYIIRVSKNRGKTWGRHVTRGSWIVDMIFDTEGSAEARIEREIDRAIDALKSNLNPSNFRDV